MSGFPFVKYLLNANALEWKIEFVEIRSISLKWDFVSLATVRERESMFLTASNWNWVIMFVWSLKSSPKIISANTIESITQLHVLQGCRCQGRTHPIKSKASMRVVRWITAALSSFCRSQLRVLSSNPSIIWPGLEMRPFSCARCDWLGHASGKQFQLNFQLIPFHSIVSNVRWVHLTYLKWCCYGRDHFKHEFTTCARFRSKRC